MKVVFEDKIKFFNRALVYKMGDFEVMKKIFKFVKKDGHDDGYLE